MSIAPSTAANIAPSNQALLDALDKVAVISTTDLQGNITYANELFCRLTGYTSDELVGRPHSLVRHPDVPKSLYKNMWDTIRDGRIWTGIIPNVGKDGSVYVVVDTTVQPMFDDAGKITSYISIRRMVNDLMEDFEAVEQAKEIFDDYYDRQH